MSNSSRLPFSSCFEDLAEGDLLPELVHEVTGEQIIRFCGAADDYGLPHWNHVWMVEHGYDGIIAHGWLSCAIMCRVVTGWPPMRDASVRDLNVRYLQPNPPGLGHYGGQIVARTMCDDGFKFRIALWGAHADGRRFIDGSVTAHL